MADIVNAAIAGASAGAVLGLGWLGAAAVGLLNAALAARRIAGVASGEGKSNGGNSDGA